MPPHHLILILVCVVGLPTLLTFFSLLHSHPRGKAATESATDTPSSGVRAFFSFHTPSTLFPPSAVISLTDDNSTFFLARPADFGPSLSAKGLSGQLWIGSGFGDDNIGRGGAGAGAEGELGCSDVPGWDDGSQSGQRGSEAKGKDGITAEDIDVGVPIVHGGSGGDRKDSSPSEEDGTDDHLHHPLPSSPVFKPAKPGQSAQQELAQSGHSTAHADIQSLQESAEISGKIVLLSRGGCGFLEKAKWTQRRGGAALIVGDHTRGGALVTMYARGDTSNVTIPSLFTSHTTAHLLSSLIPPENPSEDVDEVDAGNRAPGSGRKGSNGETDTWKDTVDDDKPTFTPPAVPRSTPAPSTSSKGRNTKLAKLAKSPSASQHNQGSSWMSSLLSTFGIGRRSEAYALSEDSRRPPSSGRLDWISPKWSDESSRKNDASLRAKENGRKAPASKDIKKLGSHSGNGDDFVIGVQDWRDPDLVEAQVSSTISATKSTTQTPLSTASLLSKAGKDDGPGQNPGTSLTGGSITPGSGQYNKPGHRVDSEDKAYQVVDINDSKRPFWHVDARLPNAVEASAKKHHNHNGEHEGLWVTLTPTTMSTSPFFDTLLVLVVSPLVTLTVVYALLLLRSRIRRRRWRAPKSVVDRLPIRTYHTMSCSSTTSSTRHPSPQTSSPTSPLLQTRSEARSRPRSATTAIGDTISTSLDRATARASLREKGGSPPQVKKKYNGKQVECVVCLEEYVDGHSRVMSLPCGHEFHAECM